VCILPLARLLPRLPRAVGRVAAVSASERAGNIESGLIVPQAPRSAVTTSLRKCVAAEIRPAEILSRDQHKALRLSRLIATAGLKVAAVALGETTLAEYSVVHRCTNCPEVRVNDAVATFAPEDAT
jgi:hypothetical protein